MNTLRRRVMADTFIVPEGAVDLRLPSRTLWATCNLGAATPEEAGLYYSWGNVIGHIGGTYSFTTNNYNSTPGKSLTVDIPTNATYDAAVAMLGVPFRIPSVNDLVELVENCISERLIINNVKCTKFTSKYNSQSIIIPDSGFYNAGSKQNTSWGFLWSSSRKDSSDAHCANFYDLDINPRGSLPYYEGLPIRPVYDPSLL